MEQTSFVVLGVEPARFRRDAMLVWSFVHTQSSVRNPCVVVTLCRCVLCRCDTANVVDETIVLPWSAKLQLRSWTSVSVPYRESVRVWERLRCTVHNSAGCPGAMQELQDRAIGPIHSRQRLTLPVKWTMGNKRALVHLHFAEKDAPERIYCPQIDRRYYLTVHFAVKGMRLVEMPREQFVNGQDRTGT